MHSLKPLELRDIFQKDFFKVQQATVVCKYCVLKGRSSELT